MRSTGRKDRHSKVCTAKGPRDRRVRLAAQTAIQFYDVQDRLGFDRPSKAVDWLIKNAKRSIDELDELPPWNPVDAIRSANTNANANAKPKRTAKLKISPPQTQPQTRNIEFHGNGNESSFLPASMDSDCLADTIKSFFPQDLRLSLQSSPPSLLHHNAAASVSTDHALFYGQSNVLGFDSSAVGWEQQYTGNGVGGGFVFASTATPTTSFQLGQSQQQFHSQRGSLQSSYTPMIRAWFDPHYQHQSISNDNIHHNVTQPVHQLTTPRNGFSLGELSSGFRIPARFQSQEEEQHDSLTNKPSAASSMSRH